MYPGSSIPDGGNGSLTRTISALRFRMMVSTGVADAHVQLVLEFNLDFRDTTQAGPVAQLARAHP
jgi:hypothetical protein